MNPILAGHLLAAFTILQWGLTFVSTKVLLADFTPVEILFDRFVIGCAAMYLLWPKKVKRRPLKHELLLIAAAFTGIDFYFIMENNALIYSLASNVSIIVATAPLFTGILDRYFGDGAKLSPSFWIGFVLAILGTALLGFNSLELKINPLGDFMALMAAIGWALYTMCVRKLYAAGYKSAEITRAIFFYALIMVIPMMCYWGYEVKPDLLIKPVNLLNYLFLGLGATTVCFFAWNVAVKLIGAVKTTFYIYLQPVVTAVGAVFLISESLTVYTVGGIILITAGLILSENYFGKLLRKHRD